MVEREQQIDAATALRRARQRLESLKRSGLEVLPRPKGRNQFELALADALDSRATATGSLEPAATAKPSASEITPAARPAKMAAGLLPGASVDQQSQYESEPLEHTERISQLQLLQTEVAGCESCSELVANRSQTVFGVGNPSPRLCFLGEGPGADEDRLGEPFVGAAGQLLNKIIIASKMQREDVYILNTVKCRPPGNRNPSETELANCWGYAQRQLEILQPEFICCLGSVAARTLLETKQSIGRLRGQFFQYRGSRVIVTYHPAYLLRNPSAKRQVWDDMKILLHALGIDL